MAIKWRPATKDDIGMPCRFHDGDSTNGIISYGQLTDVGRDMPFPFERDRYFVYNFAEVAEHEHKARELEYERRLNNKTRSQDSKRQ